MTITKAELETKLNQFNQNLKAAQEKLTTETEYNQLLSMQQMATYLSHIIGLLDTIDNVDGEEDNAKNVHRYLDTVLISMNSLLHETENERPKKAVRLQNAVSDLNSALHKVASPHYLNQKGLYVGMGLSLLSAMLFTITFLAFPQSALPASMSALYLVCSGIIFGMLGALAIAESRWEKRFDKKNPDIASARDATINPARAGLAHTSFFMDGRSPLLPQTQDTLDGILVSSGLNSIKPVKNSIM